MADVDDIRSEIGNILNEGFTTRDGVDVPEPEEVQLGNFAVKLDGTVLYADLAESTVLVNSYKDFYAAKVFKCFLRSACRVILRSRGRITAFDGDRVMAVFTGVDQDSNAVGAALELNYVVTKLINPMIKAKYTDVTHPVKHAVGVDRSPLFIARTGVRGSNDLVWVGRAANYAAKMSGFRNGDYATWITPEVYAKLSERLLYGEGSKGRQLIWEKAPWKERAIEVYGSTWYRSP